MPKSEESPLLLIPQALRELRLRKGLSEDKLGHRVGVQGSSIHKIETGNPRVDTIARNAAALGVDHHDLAEAIDRLLGFEFRKPGRKTEARPSTNQEVLERLEALERSVSISRMESDAEAVRGAIDWAMEIGREIEAAPDIDERSKRALRRIIMGVRVGEAEATKDG